MHGGPIKVLLVEDSPVAARQICDMLGEADAGDMAGTTFEVTCVNRLSLATESLGKIRFDVVLLELTLPDSLGLGTVRRTRAAARAVPIVVLSAVNDETLAVQAVQEGAQDYLFKGHADAPLLKRAIRYAIERKRAEAELTARVRQQAAVADVGRSELAGADLSALMHEAVTLVAHTLDVEYCTILEVLPEDKELLLRAGLGWKEGLVGRATVGAGTDSQAGYTLLTKNPVVVDDLRLDARFKGHSLLEEHGVVSGLSVIIGGHERSFGVLAAHTGKRRLFTQQDVDFLQAVANVLATAIHRKQAEEALRASEQQFRLAQKMEAVGRLAGGIAHDFNNLLTVITGYSDFLLDRIGMDDPLREDIEEIKKAGNRAATLTRQLLAFSRRQVLQPKVLDLNDLVANTEQMLHRLIGEDIDLVVDLNPALGPILADPGQLEQVLMNLAVNARDAMPKGGRLIIKTDNVMVEEAYVHRDFTVEPGPYVMLTVSDTGCGMGAQTLAHIFEPFFTTKEQGKGTGLGLSTVYGIVKQSGGYIWVESEPGRGARFTIYLPQVQDVIAMTERGEPLDGSPSGTETILLAEDEPGVRTLVCNTLRQHGYTVLEARHGIEALVIGHQHPGPIDLLMTDVVMPQMSGRDVADRLASIRPTTKVLYLSGYTDDAIVHHGVLDPGTAFLQKPFTPDDLARKVRAVLDGSR